MRKHLMLGGAMALLGAMTPAERAKGRYMRAPDDHKTPQQLALETKQHFDTKVDAVKAIAEDALGKIAKGETLTTQVKELADQAITGMNEAKGRLDELEQKIARQPGNDDGTEVKSYGQQLAESERLKAYMTAGGTGNMKLELKAITSAAGSAGGLIVSQRDTVVTDMPKRPDVILRDLVTVVPTTSSTIDYAKQTARTNNAAAVAEGTAKPYSNYTWARISTPVRTLAHLAKLTRQAMDDAPQLQGEIDSEMRYGLAIGEDQQILLGDGLGENLLGLMPQATPFALPAGAIAPGTSVDKLRAAVLQSTLALYAPTAFVLNPIDWYNIEISKNGQGNYLFANPLQMAGPTLWGRPVAATVSMAAGSFLTGDFKRAATLYDRMTVEVLISSENSDDFEKNLYTMRAEERLAMAVKRPAALIKGTFDAPQA